MAIHPRTSVAKKAGKKLQPRSSSHPKGARKAPKSKWVEPDWGEMCATAAVISRELALLSRAYGALNKAHNTLFAVEQGLARATLPNKPVNRRSAHLFKTINLASLFQ